MTTGRNLIDPGIQPYSSATDVIFFLFSFFSIGSVLQRGTP